MSEFDRSRAVVEFFNQRASDWAKNISQENLDTASNLLAKLCLKPGQSFLDVAAGTGILFSILPYKELVRYIAIDISDKMVESFRSIFPEADVRCLDFESEVLLETTFDYIVIFNSIPHFENLDRVFLNAYNNLKQGGKLVIAHSKTREGLKEHHQKIGYNPEKDPIPADRTFIRLSENYRFKDIVISDNDYFYFSCEK